MPIKWEVIDTRLRKKLLDTTGHMKEYPIHRWLADSKLQMIYGGTNEVMKVLIAQRLGLSQKK